MMPFNFLVCKPRTKVITWGKSHRTRLGRQIGFGEWPMLWLPSVVNGNLPKLLSYPSSSWWNRIRPCLLRKVCVSEIYILMLIGPLPSSVPAMIATCSWTMNFSLTIFFSACRVWTWRVFETDFGYSWSLFTTRTSMSSRSSYVSCTQPSRGSVHPKFFLKGGSGKGMEAYLKKALFSDLQSATLDCGVFLDRQEFRKSAEFAWNKANVGIQEMDQNACFISD